jgi:hypothetical protein
MYNKMHPYRNSAIIFLFLFISVLQVNRWNKEVREDRLLVQLDGCELIAVMCTYCTEV